ncbi:MAG: HigA family addiction module antitoxin [Thermoguttaceae bacterium]
MSEKQFVPVHPGEVLKEEFLVPKNFSNTELALALHVSETTVQKLVNCETPLSAEMALRLARFFGNSPQFWLGLQLDYDLDIEQSRSQKRILREVQPAA